jgi:hypothetical protein
MESHPRSCLCSNNGMTRIQVVLSSNFMSYLENVIYVGESINVQISVENTQNSAHVKDVLVTLVQNKFVAANRSFFKSIHRISIVPQPLELLLLTTTQSKLQPKVVVLESVTPINHMLVHQCT